MSIKLPIARALRLRKEYVEYGVGEREAERLATEEAAAESRDFVENVLKTFLERSEIVGEGQALEDTKALFTPALSTSRRPQKRYPPVLPAMSECVACGSQTATDEMEYGLCEGCGA